MIKFPLCLLVLALLAGCETDGIEWNRLDRLSDFPYTQGHRWINGVRAPPKGNCLTYALAVQRAFKLAGVESRIMIVQPDQEEIVIEPPRTFHSLFASGDFPEREPRVVWVKAGELHAIVLYRADNGKIHLVDNNCEMPVLARGTTDQAFAQQMMPPFVQARIIDHDFHLTKE